MSVYELTAERLRELLIYDSFTGLFRWRISRQSIRAGTLAGSLKESGYVHITIDGVTHCAHRLAWLYVYGVFPGPYLDHKNEIKSDNRINNLRDVSCSVNLQNRSKPRKDNLTGYLGVSNDRGRFVARIELNGTQHRIGRYSTPEEASAAYVEAKKTIHPGSFPI